MSDPTTAKGWRWLDGCASVWQQRPEHGGGRITFRADGGRPHADPWFDAVRGRWELAGADSTDPASLGCLLALVREAYGIDDLFVTRQYDTGEEWWVVCEPSDEGGDCLKGGPTEWDALTAALHAAPVRA